MITWIHTTATVPYWKKKKEKEKSYEGDHLLWCQLSFLKPGSWIYWVIHTEFYCSISLGHMMLFFFPCKHNQEIKILLLRSPRHTESLAMGHLSHCSTWPFAEYKPGGLVRLLTDWVQWLRWIWSISVRQSSTVYAIGRKQVVWGIYGELFNHLSAEER